MLAVPDGFAPPSFPEQLPITPRIGEIVTLMQRHPVLIVAGETGSGKTTQLPKACLAAGIGRRGVIAHTQPRRLAARTVAARIAEELGVRLGDKVGYAVRFSDRTSADTVVKVMTDGLLLNEIQRDPRLRRYECVIVDEAHERSLNVDFILGCLKRLLRRRRDLRVVVTSATIDVDAFAEYFDGAPVVRVGGRGYPVKTIFQEAAEDAESTSADEGALVDCLRTIAEEAPAGRRDILVFQSGEREIFDNSQLLRRIFADRFDILPLYARLPTVEQRRVFAPGGRQRVVLATNVAETSITVPNIGYVVDPGTARIARYSYRAKLQRLPVEPISQASAAQRAGRCGRVAPGVCYRLYSETDFNARPAYTDPELRRSNLAAVVLAMRAFRLGDIERFPFVDPPDPRAVRDAVRLLHELQALTGDELTAIGRTMARLPVDPRLARMLIEASRTGVLAEALIIVSALAAQDPRLRPLDRRDAADQAHALFVNDDAKRSDFLVYVNLWRWLEAQRAEHTRSGFRRVLEKRFLSPTRVREWHALHRQLLLACRGLGMKVNAQAADYATLHRALLAGSLGFIGARREPDETSDRRPVNVAGGKRKRRQAIEYDGPRALRFRLFPGSALSRAAPRWVVAAEISDTGQTYARGVAEVEPEWIEAAAKHIAKSTFSEPCWDARRGEAMVRERITVYGLAVVTERPRRAADVDRSAAREIFVREALVRWTQHAPNGIEAPFLAHNAGIERRIQELEAKGRRGDLLAGEKARAEFYLAHLPADVVSRATWRHYIATANEAALSKFKMTEADLLAGTATGVAASDFPMRLAVGTDFIPLKYKFAPGAEDDGVTARVNLGLLSALDADALEWLVPGFFEDKCVALVKGLPKALRRRLVPVPQHVQAILPKLLAPQTYRRGKLAAALSAVIHSTSGVRVPEAEWRPGALPPHLRINVQVRGANRRVVDQDRDVDALRGRLLAKVEQDVVGRLRRTFERHSLVEFPEQGVPASLEVRERTGRAVVYPVLVDRGDSVDLLIHSTEKSQAALSRRGYTRLALLSQTKAVTSLRREVMQDTTLTLRFAAVASASELADSLLRAAAWHTYFEGRELPTSRAAFLERLAAGRLAATFRELLEQTRIIVGKRFEIAKAMARLESPAFAISRADLTAQLDDIAGPDFLATTPKDRLPDIARYLDGMAVRIANLPGRVRRDQAGVDAIAPWQKRLATLRESGATETATALRFLVQEFRIATFSQRLGTREKVSAKRLQALFRAAEAAGGISA